MYYTQKAVALREKDNDPMRFMEYVSLGDCFNAMGDKNQSLDYYLKAIKNQKNMLPMKMIIQKFIKIFLNFMEN